MDNQQKKDVAKALYLMTDKTQKEICEIVGWTEKTFSESKQKNGWGESKETKSISKQQIITLLHSQTLKIVQNAQDENRMLKTNEVDCIAKLTASIDKLENTATLETYIEVFIEFNNWLMTVNSEFVQANISYQDMFVQNLIKK